MLSFGPGLGGLGSPCDAGVSLGACWLLSFFATFADRWVAGTIGRGLGGVMSRRVHGDERLGAGGELPRLDIDRRSTRAIHRDIDVCPAET